MNWLLERSFAKHHFNIRAPDLHFADVLNVGGDNDALVELVGLNGAAFDLELLEEVDVALGVNDLPMKVRRLRNLEVIRQGEDVFSVLDGVDDSSSVRLCALEFRAGVGIACKRVAGGQGERGECGEE